MRIVTLGAGFGGLELTTRLSEELGEAADVVLIDQTDGFVFGFSKLDVMFGQARAEAVLHPYADLVKPGVRFVQATIASIDPAARRVETDAGHVRGRHPGRRARRRPRTPTPRPAWSRAATSSTRWPARSPLRDVLAGFDGGRVIVGVTSTPFKCPPAPSETALLMHDFLDRPGPARPVRDRAGHAAAACRSRRRPRRRRRCSRPSPSGASSGTPSGWCAASTRRARSPCSADGGELPYDLFLGVPVHRAPAGRGGVGPGRRRLDPGRPADARDVVPRRLRRRRRHQRRHARRPACSPRARPRSSPTRSSPRSAGERDADRATTAGASATSSSAHDQVAKVDVTFLQRRRRRAVRLEGPSPAARRRQGRVRHRAASAAGSARDWPR